MTANITIHDVAQAAGVSIKTVSRVMNREANVAADTKAKVEAAAEALNYRPNTAARRLAGSKTFLIGLLLDNPSETYAYRVQIGAMNRARADGYHVIVEHVDVGVGLYAKAAEDLIKNVRVDGMILTPPASDHRDLLQLLEDIGLPYVRISPGRDLGRGARVRMDDKQAAFDMTLALIGMGHKDIGFVGSPPEHFASAQREAGFRAAMLKSGMALRDARVAAGTHEFRSGLEAGEVLLADPADRPSAIFAANDDMALGVIATAGRLNIEVPDQLSVVGFDDSPIARVVWPQLTTVTQPALEMAAAAVDLITSGAAREALEQGVACETFLRYALQIRGTTAPKAV